MMKQSDDRIGMKVGVLDANGKEYKKITITSIGVTQDGDEFYVDKDGVAYSEDQMNWTYSLTMGGALILWLLDRGYKTQNDWSELINSNLNDQVEELFNGMVDIGVMQSPDGNSTSECGISPDVVMSHWLYKYNYITLKDMTNGEHDFMEDWKTLIDTMIKAGIVKKPDETNINELI